MDTTSQFWNWFKHNNKAYTLLNSAKEEAKEKLLNDFLEQLHMYCNNIYFEIGGFSHENQELIITAEGNKNYFNQVEELINAAPKIDGWSFIAFKPSMPDNFKIKWDDLELKTEDMWFLPLLNDKTQELGIRVYFNNLELIKDHATLTALIYKMLDTIVGEKSFALDIHYVDIELLPEDPVEEDLYPILELPNYIEWHKTQTKKSST